MGLQDRGMIRAGAKADIVVFDLGQIRDVATAENIHQFSRGLEWVLVNGRETVAAGQRTGARPGLVIGNPNRAH